MIDTLTEEEFDLLNDEAEKFWVSFSKLIAHHMDAVPFKLRDHMIYMLGDRSSVFGSNYSKYMEKSTGHDVIKVDDQPAT